MLDKSQQRRILIALSQPAKPHHILLGVLSLMLLATLLGCESMPSQSEPSPLPLSCPKGQSKVWRDGRSTCVKSGLRGQVTTKYQG